MAEGIGVDLFLARAHNAPPSEREDLWAQYFALLDQARPGFLRVGLSSSRDGVDAMCPWDDQAGRFDPSHRVWAIIKRIDDWCVRHDTNWMLDPWWTLLSLQVPAPAGAEGSHSAAILDAQLIVRAMAEGVDGFCRWAWCVDRTNDGRWSLAEWEGREAVTPSPYVFPIYRALMNAIRPRAEVHAVRNSCSAGNRPRVHATAVRNTDGRRAVVLVHDMPGRNADVLMDFPPDWAGLRLRRTITDEVRKGETATEVVVPTSAPFTVELMITPYSVTVLAEA